MVRANDTVSRHRYIYIDLLKGISIIAVVLYHMGVLKSGYLGVDCFFVIGGFLSLPKIIKGVEDGRFNYFKYIRSKIVRLLPAIIIASAFSLIIGYYLWLPDDYENLSESVIASILFSNNILSGITVKNYWDAINEYKPLMHMWYIGILMEYYILTPIVVLLLNKFAKIMNKDRNRLIVFGMGVMMVCSFIIFLIPFFSASDKFYFLPFRFWEIALGGFTGLFCEKISRRVKRRALFSYISFSIIIVILCIGLIGFDCSKMGVATTIIGADYVASSNLLLPNGLLLILISILTCVFLISDFNKSIFNRSKVLSAIGRRSYSIFVWHQVMLALYRYSISNKITIKYIICFIVVLVVVSELSYRMIEKKIRDNKITIIVSLILAIALCMYSGVIYLRAGVVRDVPELGVTTDNIQRNMHSKYCDRVYSCKDEFDDNGKINVLVVGNSFARDWCNIMLESDYEDKINLYFSTHFNEDLNDKIRKADRIFVFENFEDKIPDYVWENVDNNIVYCIGTKNFGISNGPIYFHRFDGDYFSQTVPLDPGYKTLNDERKEKWGDHYIDLIEPVLIGENVRVFTDDHMFISQDCKHLTEAGARYYESLIDLSCYFPY